MCRTRGLGNHLIVPYLVIAFVQSLLDPNLIPTKAQQKYGKVLTSAKIQGTSRGARSVSSDYFLTPPRS